MDKQVSLFSEAGALLYGPSWQRAIARGMGPLHPSGPRDAIDDRQVRRWVSGNRPILPWAVLAAADLLDNERVEMERNCNRMREIAGELRSTVQPGR